MTGGRHGSGLHVAIVGCGGLGGPIAYALAAAGARLTLIDDDRVELSNLQRQVQFSTADLGRPKVVALAGELARRGVPADRLRTAARRFDQDSAAALLAGCSAVIDGSDDLATKFAVSDAAVARGIPAVIASVLRYEGQIVRVRPGGPCYRCLFEAPPIDVDADSCATAGVLGAAVAVIAGHAARAVLELLAGDQRRAPLDVFTDLAAGTAPRSVHFHPREGCPACASPEVRSRYHHIEQSRFSSHS